MILMLISLCLIILMYNRCFYHESFSVNKSTTMDRTYIANWKNFENDYGQHMFYVPSKKVLITVFPKGGSSSILSWLNTILGITIRSDCHNDEEWGGKITRLYNKNQRKTAIKTSKYRVLIWRDPIDRFLSAWKSKLCFDSMNFKTDSLDRSIIIPKLNKELGIKKYNSNGVSFADFSKILQRIVSISPEKIDYHFKPFPKEVDFVTYSDIIQLEDLDNKNKMKSLCQALGTQTLPLHKHKTTTNSETKKVDNYRKKIIKEILSKIYSSS